MHTIIVPAQLVGVLREGLHSEIGNAAEAIAQAADQADRERRPEAYREPFGHLDRTRALLDLIDRSTPHPAIAVRVDLCEHREAVLGALDVALIVGDADLEDAEKVDADRAARGEAPIRETTTRRVFALREFRAAIEVHADDSRESRR